jgi:hypothetical protein
VLRFATVALVVAKVTSVFEPGNAVLVVPALVVYQLVKPALIVFQVAL